MIKEAVRPKTNVTAKHKIDDDGWRYKVWLFYFMPLMQHCCWKSKKDSIKKRMFAIEDIFFNIFPLPLSFFSIKFWSSMLRGMYIERRMHFNLIDNKSSTNFSIVALQSRFSRNERNLEDLQHFFRS